MSSSLSSEALYSAFIVRNVGDRDIKVDGDLERVIEVVLRDFNWGQLPVLLG